MNVNQVHGFRMAGLGLVLAAAVVPAMLLAWADASHSSKVQRAPVTEVIPKAITIDGKRAPWEGPAVKVERGSADRGSKARTIEGAGTAVPLVSSLASAAPVAGASPTTVETPAATTTTVSPRPANAPTASAPAATADGPWVVVELFTSEGCSSCPPAEAYLNELAAVPERNGVRVHGLVHHVDYWDRLGWKDPYASKEASERQRMYAEVFRERSVYTPQMVVNGRVGFVGSDRAVGAKELELAAKAAPLARVALHVGPVVEQTSIRVQWTVEPLARASGTSTEAAADPSDWVVYIALVQSGLETAVKSGENKGRTLRHDRVVRSTAEIPLRKGVLTGVAALDPMQHGRTPFDASKSAVVVFVQSGKGQGIVGVAEVGLSMDARTDAHPDTKATSQVSEPAAAGPLSP